MVYFFTFDGVSALSRTSEWRIEKGGDSLRSCELVVVASITHVIVSDGQVAMVAADVVVSIPGGSEQRVTLRCESPNDFAAFLLALKPQGSTTTFRWRGRSDLDAPRTGGNGSRRVIASFFATVLRDALRTVGASVDSSDHVFASVRQTYTVSGDDQFAVLTHFLNVAQGALPELAHATGEQ